jgi:hypothetical protein
MVNEQTGMDDDQYEIFTPIDPGVIDGVAARMVLLTISVNRMQSESMTHPDYGNKAI